MFADKISLLDVACRLHPAVAMVAGADAFVGIADGSRSPGRRRIMSVVTRARSVDAVHTHPEWNVEWMKEENAVEISSRRA